MKKTKIISLILSAILAVGTFTASMSVSADTTTSSVTASTKTPSKSKLKISAMSKAKKTITLSWTKSTNAKKYIILSSLNGGAYTTIDTTTKLKYTYNVPEDGVYKFKIRAVNGTKTRTSNIVKKTVVWYSDGADFLNKGTFILDGEKMKLPDMTYWEMIKAGYCQKGEVFKEFYEFLSKRITIVPDYNGESISIISKAEKPEDDFRCIEILYVVEKGKLDDRLSEICYQCRYYDINTETFTIPENALKIYFAKGLNYNSSFDKYIEVLGNPDETIEKKQMFKSTADEWGNTEIKYVTFTTAIWTKGDKRLRLVFNPDKMIVEFSIISVIPTEKYGSFDGALPYGQELCNYEPRNYGYGLLEEETTD